MVVGDDLQPRGSACRFQKLVLGTPPRIWPQSVIEHKSYIWYLNPQSPPLLQINQAR